MTQAHLSDPAAPRVFRTEQAAIDYLTALRWARGRFCPLCGNAFADKIRTLKVGGAPSNIHKCYKCNRRFSIKVGTIFEDTRLPLRTWFAAIWMITHNPRGVSSVFLAQRLEISQKAAWHILHRLRHAAETSSFQAPLKSGVRPKLAALEVWK